jgi:HAMP domain-containing protein
MGLRMKFNLVLLLAFVIGLALAAYLTDRILKQNAREEVLQNARIMMESAMGARAYTVQRIQPLLTLQMKREFRPETVAAFAAAQSFQALREKFPEYTYKEAALNPTNPNDRASDWEADIIHEFRNNAERKELTVERDTPTGRMLNLARPLGIYNDNCLVCHGRVEDAPKTMTDIYGVNNGFGWKMGEIIGAQIVTVPMSVPLARAQQIFTTFMILLSGVFGLLLVLLNILLHFVVIRPVVTIADIANEVSLGKPDVPEYVRPGRDEISSLSQSFNRMRLSLENAMKMLGE